MLRLRTNNFLINSLRRMASTIYQFKAKDSDGAEVSLDKYKGKVVIIVNTASQCGFTDTNYTQLNQILEKYKKQGLEIAAFPCNQFNGQEPGCDADIKAFVHEKYKFDPDLYSKVEVNGDNAHPLWKFLKKEQGGTLFDAIKWNFTKFLVNKKGEVINRYGPKTEPNSMIKDIEKALAEDA
ncbi:unnamed protein product [Bursaphelenchus okinawaensis]|uniref:Glutathione peroxidase n=1 Tax=Bursaphelenchus okinawaensis TaxID=465554 RepID=A0A811K299_9BILA|nr:unnamed protein product [Bursaphelenchus okinawaensis]CAG9090073.1 unnamed protein product [Bursaphelenchus okinawaensis]